MWLRPVVQNELNAMTLTPRAAEYIKKLLNDAGIRYLLGEGGMRFGVRAGGCQGLHYFFEPVKNENRGDYVMILRGVRIIVDPKSIIKLIGTEIDASENLLGGPFIYRNPNAKNTCGCETSFETKAAK